MFRLKDRQLHILIGLLCGASILLFCVFGFGKMPKMREFGTISGMKDFSEAWVCTYETEDADKLKEYQNIEGDKTIIEVVSFPAAFMVEKGKTVTLTHKLPDMDMETIYLTLETNRQKVRIFAGEDMLYSSAEADQMLSAFHIVPIAPQYKNMVITIELTGQSKNQIEIGTIQTGTYSEVLAQAFLENGSIFIVGFLLVGISICMFVVWLLAKNVWRQKKLLLYCCMEGFFIGVLFLAESRIVQVIVNWNYGIYFIKSCLIVIVSVLHLMTIRCFIYKKRVLSLVDAGILFYGIFYISMMVIQAFSLVQFDNIYFAGKILYIIGIFLYTLVLVVAIYGYGRKEGKPVFFANVILTLCLLAQISMQFSGGNKGLGNFYVPCGFFLYMIWIWIYGLKHVFCIQSQKEAVSYDEAAIKTQMVEQLNPNLLFASFQTLQNLIKNGSPKSVKMIYYISVYVRDNLKALERSREIISFEEELEHIIAYLQLQKTRNQNLDFSIECKERTFKVPRHSIEPMVENAVKHGIANQNNKGNVVIRTYQREEGYAIQVIDDGAGFDKRVLQRKSPTALLNLFALLEQTCKAKTEVISKEGKGTVITMILPMLENDLMEKD